MKILKIGTTLYLDLIHYLNKNKYNLINEIQKCEINCDNLDIKTREVNFKESDLVLMPRDIYNRGAEEQYLIDQINYKILEKDRDDYKEKFYDYASEVDELQNERRQLEDKINELKLSLEYSRSTYGDILSEYKDDINENVKIFKNILNLRPLLEYNGNIKDEHRGEAVAINILLNKCKEIVEKYERNK